MPILMCLRESFPPRQTIGTNDKHEVDPEQIEDLLHASCEYIYFRETQLYASIRQWEKEREKVNEPFVVFKAELPV